MPCKDEDLGFLTALTGFLSKVAGLGGRSGLARPDIAPVLLWKTQDNEVSMKTLFSKSYE